MIFLGSFRANSRTGIWLSMERDVAVVSITIDNAIAIHDIKLVQGDERMFVAMPSRREDSGIFRDIIHPISANIREKIEEQILDAYNEYIQ